MDRRVQVVIRLMKENLDQDMLIPEVAKWLNISPSRLRYLFKAETGHSPAHYLKILRMQKAKLLVESTFLNVKQIMCELGINDESHFVRDFKRTYGVTITEYRHVCDSNACIVDEAGREQKKQPINSKIRQRTVIFANDFHIERE